MPKAVGVGIFLQFSVMPAAGWVIANAFGFPPEVAAGVILIGSCSGGVASNVMAYLARGNVALSVTMTACSTLLAPVLTPAAMQLLAGKLVPINFWQMMVEIIWMVIVPIVGGLLFNWMLHGKHAWLDQALPVVSMAAICYIIAIITANARDKLLEVAFALIGAAMLHNTVGYLLGYWGARAMGLSETDCRTVAFEVGMQNGGMGTGLAINVLQSADAALAPNIFGTWMNISGSTLASWWRERPPADTGMSPTPEAAEPEEMPAVT
jgi:BASS family bile acid:Na+ symporter